MVFNPGEKQRRIANDTIKITQEYHTYYRMIHKDHPRIPEISLKNTQVSHKNTTMIQYNTIGEGGHVRTVKVTRAIARELCMPGL